MGQPVIKLSYQHDYTRRIYFRQKPYGSNIRKNGWHQQMAESFFVEVILLFMTIKGKINFTQMGRYSSSPEVRFRNMFKRVFDFVSFNSMFITKHCSDELLIGFDPSYLSKSGKYTPNVGYFYSGVAGMIKRGMEVGCLAIIDVKQNTAYHFEAVTDTARQEE
ncbi:MAG: hypothetical protein IPJ13_14405 [Saprospiraceae bacterium]|nr:hypothetical protein [Saprospiraceae bacterium]